MDSDPYEILHISYHSDEATIQAALQEQIKSSKDSEALIEAYGRIRDAPARERFRWSDLRFCEAQMSAKVVLIEVDALIQELAFLSPWEMGDDACLN